MQSPNVQQLLTDQSGRVFARRIKTKIDYAIERAVEQGHFDCYIARSSILDSGDPTADVLVFMNAAVAYYVTSELKLSYAWTNRIIDNKEQQMCLRIYWTPRGDSSAELVEKWFEELPVRKPSLIDMLQRCEISIAQTPLSTILPGDFRGDRIGPKKNKNDSLADRSNYFCSGMGDFDGPGY